jgi:hypothetical protein
MEPETKAKVMFGVLGLICGGIIAMIIGFNWGGGWLDNLRHYQNDDQTGGLGE